jgi:hypothetical protein
VFSPFISLSNGHGSADYYGIPGGGGERRRVFSHFHIYVYIPVHYTPLPIGPLVVFLTCHLIQVAAEPEAKVKIEDKEAEELFNPTDYNNLNGKTEVILGSVVPV